MDYELLNDCEMDPSFRQSPAEYVDILFCLLAHILQQTYTESSPVGRVFI